MFFIAGGLSASDAPGVWVLGLGSMLIGASLLIGFMTPISGGLATLGYLATALYRQVTATGSWNIVALPALLLAAMSAALVLLGPGSVSLDARLFGRRDILIPSGQAPAGRPEDARRQPE
ncbi:MAG TPA: hypothetical protein VHU89_08225 [Acidobacteriaceae bacterium]|jgi:uncharacterized membrane protein YphA (DoxX/SURF4 family)|nr:hypothetical protein [Acidobacteriaceae bacterium]